jgi:hypothetical protein
MGRKTLTKKRIARYNKLRKFVLKKRIGKNESYAAKSEKIMKAAHDKIQKIKQKRNAQLRKARRSGGGKYYKGKLTDSNLLRLSQKYGGARWAVGQGYRNRGFNKKNKRKIRTWKLIRKRHGKRGYIAKARRGLINSLPQASQVVVVPQPGI